jgi:hypothetical protein
MIKWEEIAADPRYQALDDSGRIAAASGYFKEYIEPSEAYNALSQRDKNTTKFNFYNDRDTVPGVEPKGAIGRQLDIEKQYLAGLPSDIAEGYKKIFADPREIEQGLRGVVNEAPGVSDLIGAAEAGVSIGTMAVSFPAAILSGVGELLNQSMAGGEGDFDWKKVREETGQVMQDLTYEPKTVKGQMTIEPVGRAFESAINYVAEAVTPMPKDLTSLMTGEMSERSRVEYEQTLERNKYFTEAALLLVPFVKRGASKVVKLKSSKELRSFIEEGKKVQEKNLAIAVEKIEAGKQDTLTPQERYAASVTNKIPKVEEPLVVPPVGLSTEVVAKPTTIKATDLITDPAVKARYENAVIKKPGMLDRASDFISKAARNTFRGAVAELPRGTAKERAFFAEARDSIQTLGRQKGAAINKTIGALEAVTQDLVRAKDVEGYNLFSLKVLLDDLAVESGKGNKLPYGYTPDTLARDIAKVDAATQAAPNVLAALEKRGALMDAVKTDYVKAMQDIGVDLSERMANPDYFRHQVLDYVQEQGMYGTGERLKAPTQRGFLKKRKGSELDINRDYLQVESEVLSQMMYDTQLARTIKTIDTKYNMKPDMKPGEPVPDGYVEWQPREGSVFYRSYSIPEKVAMEAMTEGISSLMGKDVKDILVMGGKRKSMVIPVEVADALNSLTKKSQSGFGKRAMKKWKQWQLVSPRRFTKYNLRNMTGDADAVFVGNPSGFKYMPRAASELYDVMALKKSPSPELAEWLDRGGLEGTLQAQEMGSGLKELKTFSQLFAPEGGVAKSPSKIWHGYWKKARQLTDFREAWLRYANFLDYLEQMKRNPEGKPGNFGASLREEVMGLSDPNSRAYKLSNELLGAYDDISPVGQGLRERFIPFWSWNEVNFKRYKRFAVNAAMDGKSTAALGRKFTSTAIKSPLMAYRMGKLAIKSTALLAALQVWNTKGVPQVFGEDLEAQLPEKKRSRSHIILGRDKDGNIISFDRLGAFSDFLEWFGMDAAPGNVDAYLKGRKSIKDIAVDTLMSPVNKIWQGAVPIEKLALETAMGKTTYPDIQKQRTIRDRGLHIAGSFGLDNEYKALMGLPSRPYTESMWNLLTYKINPGEAAMGDIYDLRRDYMKKIGKSGEGFFHTDRGQAIYNYKLALKLEDKDAAEKYFTEYVRLSANAGKDAEQIYDGIQKSLSMLHPIAGIANDDIPGFLEYIGEEGKDRLKEAILYYNDIRSRSAVDLAERAKGK